MAAIVVPPQDDQTQQFESVSSGFQAQEQPKPQTSDPLFEALVKNSEEASSATTTSNEAPQFESVSSGFQEEPKPQASDPLFEALAKEGEAPVSEPSASMASSSMEGFEEKKRRALALLQAEGLGGFGGI